MMPASTLLPKLLFGLAAVGGLILGLTTYTFPIFGHVRDDDVIAVIHRGLGDTVTSLPGPPSSLPIQNYLQPADPFGNAFERRPSPAAPQPAAWAARAATADSAALRDWLDHSGLFTGSSDGTTRNTTLWRLTLHPGCPLISQLRTVTTIASGQLVEISSDCPRTGDRVEGNGTH
jgi:hypothetical protein